MKVYFFFERKYKYPLLTTFRRFRGTAFPPCTMMPDIIHITLPNLNGNPVPGIPDVDFNLKFIVTSLEVHIPFVQTWKYKSGFRISWLLPFAFRVSILPVFQITQIGRCLAKCTADCAAEQVAWKFIKLMVEVIRNDRTFLCPMDQ